MKIFRHRKRIFASLSLMASILLTLNACALLPSSPNNDVLATEVAATLFAGLTAQADMTPPAPNPKVILLDNAEQIIQLDRWGSGVITHAAFTPDGSMLAVSSSVGIHLYQADSLSESGFLETPASVSYFTFSPQGDLLAASSYAGTVWLWRLPDESPAYTLKLAVDSEQIKQVAFSPDGKLLAALSPEAIYLCRTADGGLLRTLDFDWGVSTLVFSPDSTAVIAGGDISSGYERNWLMAWSVADGSVLDQLAGGINLDLVRSFALSPDGSLLAMGFENGKIRLWQSFDGTLLNTLEGHSEAIDHLIFSADGQVLVSSAWDNIIRTWGVAEGIMLQSFENVYRTSTLALTSKGERLAIAAEQALKLYEVRDGKYLGELIFWGRVHELMFSPGGDSLAIRMGSEVIICNPYEKTYQVSLQKPAEGWFDAIGFLADGTTLAAAFYQPDAQPLNFVGVWDAGNGSFLRQLEGVSVFDNMTASSDGKFLATDVYDEIHIWDTSDLNPITFLQHDCSSDRFCDFDTFLFSPNGDAFAAAIEDGTFYLWDTQTWQLETRREFPCDSEYCQPVLAFTPDGRMLAVGSGRRVGLWNAAQGILVNSLEHEDWISSLAFSPNGEILATGGYQRIWLWRVSDGNLIRTIDAHGGIVTTLSFSPDGALLASGSSDGTILFWGLP